MERAIKLRLTSWAQKYMQPHTHTQMPNACVSIYKRTTAITTQKINLGHTQNITEEEQRKGRSKTIKLHSKIVIRSTPQ